MSYNQVFRAVEEHFDDTLLDELALTQRSFPSRVLPDLHRALAQLADFGFAVLHFAAAQQGHQPIMQFAQLFDPSPHMPIVAGAPQYLDIDIGEDHPMRCLTHGLWLLKVAGRRCAVLFYVQGAVAVFQVAASPTPGKDVAAVFFKYLEVEVEKALTYRGKVLSLDAGSAYTGQYSGILVHRLRPVPREAVILPPSTLAMLDRNVARFIEQRPRLRKAGLATKKGVLFHGPPGTGKTHTIHYLIGAALGQTTLLITAEQIVWLGEYMTLARLYQPCLVVIEDVDLIAQERSAQRSAGEQALLNKLLNEMDGLRPDADILFVLTTNRPEVLEEALAARPGRIDQAIEFPFPDDEGRATLMRLYAQQVPVPPDVIAHAVARTANVSASFIKELMRRSVQFAFERDAGEINGSDIDAAIDELLVRGGPLNRKLLGADQAGGVEPPAG
jgi:cell division protease FtsH